VGCAVTAVPITLETEDLVGAARMLRLWCVDELVTSTNSLCAALADCGGMAGNDAGGLAWAAAYDRAAAAALRANADVLNGVETVGSMLAQTARNYAAAEAASTADERYVVDATLAALPPALAPYFLPVCLPSSAVGGSGGPPSGWSLVEHLVGYVWPNGHQDRLRRAASAWRSSGQALRHAADNSVDACRLALTNGLPEADDIWTVCEGMAGRLRRVGELHGALGAACDELAGHIDEVHAEVIGELESLLAWSAGIQVLGGLLSIASFGTAEAPTQAAEAGRIASAAARISQLIERFVALARAAAQSVVALSERADQISAELLGLNGVRLSTAAVTQIKLMPKALRVREALATRRISDEVWLALRHLDEPKLFDPTLLEGRAAGEIRVAIPRTWKRTASRSGGGEVFIDPVHKGRRIRLMPGYPPGSRADLVTTGPYAVVSQLGKEVKVPLAGNPTLR
jgi:hypothetical protein